MSNGYFLLESRNSPLRINLIQIFIMHISMTVSVLSLVILARALPYPGNPDAQQKTTQQLSEPEKYALRHGGDCEWEEHSHGKSDSKQSATKADSKQSTTEADSRKGATIDVTIRLSMDIVGWSEAHSEKHPDISKSARRALALAERIARKSLTRPDDPALLGIRTIDKNKKILTFSASDMSMNAAKYLPYALMFVFPQEAFSIKACYKKEGTQAEQHLAAEAYYKSKAGKPAQKLPTIKTTSGTSEEDSIDSPGWGPNAGTFMTGFPVSGPPEGINHQLASASQPKTNAGVPIPPHLQHIPVDEDPNIDRNPDDNATYLPGYRGGHS